MKNLIALIDWDGTVRKDFTIRSWSSYLHDKGLLSNYAVSAIEEQFRSYDIGKISHDILAENSANIFAKSLRGIHEKLIKGWIQEFIRRDNSSLLKRSLKLLQALYNRGIKLYVVSGAPREILLGYGKELSIYAIYGLDMEIKKGKYTGEVNFNPGLSTNKKKVVEMIMQAPHRRIVAAIGNSDSDMPLFDAAPVCVWIGEASINANKTFMQLKSNLDIPKILKNIEKEVNDYE